jgi:hypothetical protein
VVALRKRAPRREPEPAPTDKPESPIPAAPPKPVSAAPAGSAEPAGPAASEKTNPPATTKGNTAHYPADTLAATSASAAADNPAALATPPKDALLRRLAEMEEAQRLNQEMVAMQQAQIAAQMQRDLTVEQRVERLPLPDSAKQWLLAHPEYVADQDKNNRLGQLHHNATQEHEAFSPGYFDHIERAEGLRPHQPETSPQLEEQTEEPSVQYDMPPQSGAQLATEARQPNGHDTTQRLVSDLHRLAPRSAPPPPAPAPTRPPLVSAPVNRESTSFTTGRATPNRVTLTPAERQICRATGCDEVSYARGKLLLEQRRAAGLLQDG